MRTSLFGFFILLCALVFIWASFPSPFVYADSATQMTGWAWSENIGWISFNSKNCDANKDGQSDGTPSGCPAAGTPMTQYGVTRQSNGDLTGYAWSEHIGWIKFDPSGPYPGSPNRSARVPNVGAASGWFRAIASDASWDGWMKFDSGGNYGSGVSLGGSQGTTLQGYGWGSDVVGWIHMSGVTQSGNAYGINIGGGQVSNLTADVSGPGITCAANPQPSISWTYTDADGLSQSAYQVQIDTNQGFGNPIVDSAKVTSTSNTYVAPAGILNYGTLYYYRVRVWNTNDVASPYAVSSMTTTAHRGPTVAFTSTPTKPVKGVEATMTDQTTTSGGASIASRSWTFPVSATNTTPPADGATEKIIFRDQSNPVTLSVTDSDNLTCSLQKTITAVSPVLEFKETTPQ